MDNKNLKSATLSGMIWKSGERFANQSVSFIVSLILARILAPEDYGVIAIVTVFINIMNVFVTSGYGAALIQKKDSDDNDYNSMFTFSGLLSVFLYFVLFFTAPLIAKIYKNDILVPLIRVMALRMPIASFNSIQQAYVAKKMQFRKFFLSTLGGTVFSAIVGISMALSGYGVWALACQYLTSVIIDTIILFIQFDWRYKPYYSHKLAVPMIKFGSRVLCATLIDSVYQEIRTLIIGKKYDTSSLAYYNRGEQFPKLIVLNFSTVIDGVLLPAFCKLQDDIYRLRTGLRRSVQVSTFVVMPAMILMAIVAKPMITIILTEKWLNAVPYVQIFCISYMFNPLQSSSTQVIKALGKSNVYLMLEIIKKSIFVVALLFAMHFGVYIIAVSALITSLISCLINQITIRKMIDYSLVEQFRDIMPQFLLSVIMGTSVYLTTFFVSNSYLLLITQVFVGVALYIALAFVFKIDSFKYVLNIIKNKKEGAKQ